MLLTAIAFRLAINESLPVIDHLTLLDKYILSAYLLLSLVAVQMTVTFRLHATHAATNQRPTCAAGPGHAAAASPAEESPAGPFADADAGLRRIGAADSAGFAVASCAWLSINLLLLLARLCPGLLSDSWTSIHARHADRRCVDSARYQKMRFG